MHLGLLFINQLQRLHSKPWFSLDLLFKSHGNSSCYLSTTSIVAFLLENLGTCIMRAFHLPNVICVAITIKYLLLLDWSACFLMIGPCSGHLLCLCVTIWLVCSLFTTQIHALLFHWFTCLFLFGSYIDHCLVHVSPFNWHSYQIILQIIILNFVLSEKGGWNKGCKYNLHLFICWIRSGLIVLA